MWDQRTIWLTGWTSDGGVAVSWMAVCTAAALLLVVLLRFLGQP
jgi:hypothetical protein